MKFVQGLLVMLVSSSLALERTYDMDRFSSCNQEVTLFDEDVIINGRSNAAPANPPTECEIYLKSGYTDGKNRLQVLIEVIAIEDCAVYVDVFNGRGIYGNLLRRMGCSSENRDTLYSDQEWVTIMFKRSGTLYQTAYEFRFKVQTYQDPDLPGILLGGTRLPPGAIIGIVVGLLAIILLAIILIWCWKSGRLGDYIGWSDYSNDDEKLGKDMEKSVSNGEDNNGVEKFDKTKSQSVSSGIDHRDPAVWNTITSGKYDPSFSRQTNNTQFLGRASYRKHRPRRFDDELEDGIRLTGGQNGDATTSPQIGDQGLQNDRQALQGEGHNRGTDGQGYGGRSRGQPTESSKETLIDDVFESDDNRTTADKYRPDEAHRNYSKRPPEDGGGSFRRGDPKRGSGEHRSSGRGENEHGSFRRGVNGSPTRGSKRRDEDGSPTRRRGVDGSPTRGSMRRGEDGSPTRGSMRRHEEGSPTRGSLRRNEEGVRGSNRSTASNQEIKNQARSLANEAAAKNRKASKPGQKGDPLVDNAYSGIPESPPPPPLPSLPGGDKSSDDSELREINAHTLPSGSHADPYHQNYDENDPEKSPSSKKKKKKKKTKHEEEDRLPPEAFEPLFSNPVSEDPYPQGMQPFGAGGYNLYGAPGGMYPMPGYGMPYGMMPAPGMVPPGTQTYAYAYQTAPAPGATPQVAGKAAWIVQETPTKHGPVQKTAFMMATTQPRPENNSRDTNYPHSASEHVDTPKRKGSGRKKTNRPSDANNPNNSAIVPAGAISPDNGRGHRTAMMKSGVDPDTGIETNQVLWTDTTRDPSDPPPGANPQITRKTVIRTTTRSGYGELPEHMDEITDHLYLEVEPHDQPFLTPSHSGQHSLPNNSTPDNLMYYLGNQNRHGGSSQHIVHPAPSRNKAIRDSVSIA